MSFEEEKNQESKLFFYAKGGPKTSETKCKMRRNSEFEFLGEELSQDLVLKKWMGKFGLINQWLKIKSIEVWGEDRFSAKRTDF